MNTCEHCKSSFTPARYAMTRYCSRRCNDAARHEAQRTHTPGPSACEWCGDIFITYRSGHRWCSRKCRERGVYREKVGWPPGIECNWCSTRFNPMTHKRGRQNRYCSDLCRTKTVILSSYSTTGRDLFALLEKQGGECATGCGTPLSLMVGRGDPRAAHVDHDHSCCDRQGSCGKCVRGLLCPPCNQSLGWLERPGVDPIQRCAAILHYLSATKENAA